MHQVLKLAPFWSVPEFRTECIVSDQLLSAYFYDFNRDIWEQSKELEHVPIYRSLPKVSASLYQWLSRYNERNAVERFNGRLKDKFGGRNVMVRGREKVMLHLMFGVYHTLLTTYLNLKHKTQK